MQRCVKARKPMRRSKRYLLVSLPILLLSLSGCATSVNSPNVPPCPVAGPQVADEVSRLNPGEYPATFNWLARIKQHCEAIEVIRG